MASKRTIHIPVTRTWYLHGKSNFAMCFRTWALTWRFTFAQEPPMQSCESLKTKNFSWQHQKNGMWGLDLLLLDMKMEGEGHQLRNMTVSGTWEHVSAESQQTRISIPPQELCNSCQLSKWARKQTLSYSLQKVTELTDWF
jgi:hypothetical protein